MNENIQSALIFEDDADWDIGIRAQLTQLARGAKYLQRMEEDAVSSSPYGDKWDMLWLGHCGQFTMASDKRRFVIPEDPTVEPTEYRKYWLENPNMSKWDLPSNAVNDTRIIFRSSGGSKSNLVIGSPLGLFPFPKSSQLGALIEHVE